MNFDAFSGNRRTRRQPSSDYSPAIIESLETRALLTPGPSILSPGPTINVSQPTVTWQAIPNAIRYDLWVSDVEARERIVYKEGIVGTSTTLTSAERLNLGVNRIWVRATVVNPQTQAASKTDWGTPRDVLLQARPTVTGPVAAGNRAALEFTSANHGLTTGQKIRISGVVGIAAANGEFDVIVTSTNTFSVSEVAGTGKYVSGGSWIRVTDGIAANPATARAITGVVATPKIDGSDWAITWTSPVGAETYEVLVSNQTTQTATTYIVNNDTPATEADGEVNASFIRDPALEITSANHGLINGQQIRISGVVGINAANGDFTVVVNSVNTFRLNGVIGTGSYTAGGTWVKIVNGVAAAPSTSKAITNVAITNSGHQIEQEVRTLYLDGAVSVSGATPRPVSSVLNRFYLDVTSPNHGLVTGARVRISGVQGNTAANGSFTVTSVSENVFRLNGIVGNGSYIAGGSWVLLNGNVQVPGTTARPISRVTNTSAIDVIVLNHGLKTGDQVRITGVNGNAAANGTFFVTVISANAIQLRGVAGQSAYTGGGQLTKLTNFKSTLDMGKYRVFVRSRDDGGRVSPWSTAYDFEIAPTVEVQGPRGSTFSNSQPLLEWDAVPGATHYQVEVYGVDVRVTSADHGLTTGDTLRVSGVRGLSGANGEFTVTVINKDVFRLNGALGTGTYTAGGSWRKLSAGVLGPARTLTNVTLQKDATVPLYEADYLVNTSFQLPFRISRSMPLISVQGNPTSGTYRISFTVSGEEVVNVQTAPLAYNATAAQIKAAINAIAGLESFEVVVDETAPVFTYRIQIPSDFDDVTASVIESVNPGTVVASTTTIPGEVQEFDFRVRARKLHQVQSVTLRGNPTTGSYSLQLTTIGENPVTVTTATLPYTATAAEVQSAINALSGFGSVTVSSQTVGPDVTLLIQFPLTGNNAEPGTFSGNPVLVQLLESSAAGNVINITSANHGLFTGARVRISGVSGLTQANGDFTVTVVNGNVFRLNGVFAAGSAPVTSPSSGQWILLLGNSPQTGAAAKGITAVGTARSLETTRRLSTVDGLWSPLTTFSTLRKPTITGPIGIDNADPNLPPTVTDLRPTITWTAIDGAARYDIRVDRASSTGVYLQTTSPTNSYRFEISILAGNYTVQVRAVSRTGELSEWSNSYSFTATAGASVIRSAAVISGQRARILWEGVAEAATYEVQIAWIGVNFDFIHPTGLLTTSYTTTAGLAPGNYRVWVRAIMADGTRLSWSTPADFTVVDGELPESDELQLTALLPPASTRRAQTAQAPQAVRPESKTESEESAATTPVVLAEAYEATTGESTPVMSPAVVLDAAELNDAELIQMLAEACLHQEWWTTSEGTST